MDAEVGNLPQTMFTAQDAQSSAEAPSPEPTETVNSEPQPQAEAPASSEPQAPASEPEETLYELPDGRKVDAETLQKEWRENFLPEYTRKSQRLSEIEKTVSPNINNEQKQFPWQDANWVPQSYQEILDAAEQRLQFKAQQQAEYEKQVREQIQTEAQNQLSELKKADPNLDENALFVHANKYGFSNLKAAYQNITDMNNVVKSTQAQTVKNLQTREADPVATTTGEVADEGIDYGAIRGRGIHDIAQEAFARLKGK